MPQLQGIPTPTDSYDRAHTSLATITSLRALSASFDATVESLTETVHGHMRRLDDLASRAQRCQDKVDRLRRSGNDEERRKTSTDGGGAPRTIKISCPECYESVTEMGDVRFELGRRTRSVGGGGRGVGTTVGDELMDSSALSRARSKSNAAVLSVLQREAAGAFEEDVDRAVVSEARPSDVWLDRASAFEEGKTARLAVRLDAVPPLVVDNSVTICGGASSPWATVEEEEADYYKLGMRQIEQEKSSSVGSAEGGLRQGSVTTEMSRDTTGTSYSVLSHATASHRRRQRILAAASSRRAEGVGDHQSDLGSIIYHGISDGNSDGINNTSLARQQAMTGSLPYLCEVLHDTYGLGAPPSDFDSGNVFREIKDVCDLTIYGTTRMAYGSQASPSLENDSNSSSDIIQRPGQRVGKEYSNGKGIGRSVSKLEPVGCVSRDTTLLSTKSNPTAYVPNALAKDAGLFQLPENLPL